MVCSRPSGAARRPTSVLIGRRGAVPGVSACGVPCGYLCAASGDLGGAMTFVVALLVFVGSARAETPTSDGGFVPVGLEALDEVTEVAGAPFGMAPASGMVGGTPDSSGRTSGCLDWPSGAPRTFAGSQVAGVTYCFSAGRLYEVRIQLEDASYLDTVAAAGRKYGPPDEDGRWVGDRVTLGVSQRIVDRLMLPGVLLRYTDTSVLSTGRATLAREQAEQRRERIRHGRAELESLFGPPALAGWLSRHMHWTTSSQGDAVEPSCMPVRKVKEELPFQLREFCLFGGEVYSVTLGGPDTGELAAIAVDLSSKIASARPALQPPFGTERGDVLVLYSVAGEAALAAARERHAADKAREREERLRDMEGGL